MNRLFECLNEGFFKVPDGTLINPFLNPKDIMSGLPWDVLNGLGITAGCINPGSAQKTIGRNRLCGKSLLTGYIRYLR